MALRARSARPRRPCSGAGGHARRRRDPRRGWSSARGCGRLDREADEAGLAPRRRPPRAPARARSRTRPRPAHGARRAPGHRHLEAAAKQAADAAAPVTMRRRDPARLEVHAVAAHQPARAAREIDRVLEQHPPARRGRRLADQLDPVEHRARGAGVRGALGGAHRRHRLGSRRRPGARPRPRRGRGVRAAPARPRRRRGRSSMRRRE